MQSGTVLFTFISIFLILTYYAFAQTSNPAEIRFDRTFYKPEEKAILRVTDYDMNIDDALSDSLEVHVQSRGDIKGLFVILLETGNSTGIFEKTILFTIKGQTNNTALKVRSSDIVTAKYIDRTFEPPEVLFAEAIIGKVLLERAVASSPHLVDETGAPLTDISVGSQVLIQSEIKNSQTNEQPFAYIVQIKDENGVTVSLSWIKGELPANESLKVVQSWIPDAAGDFTVEIFVWESVDKPVALSPVRTTKVSVS